MSLSCGCVEWEPEPGEWAYWWDRIPDFEPLQTSKRKRCCSCKQLINIGTPCVRHPRYRYPYNEVEARITGCEWNYFEEPPIRIADHYQCERCGEIWLNLETLGFECLQPNENMEESLQEYWELTGFKPNDYDKKIR